MALLALSAASCSIFEDRSLCPAFVALDLEYQPERSHDASFKLMRWTDGRLVEMSDRIYSESQHSYDIPVDDGMNDIVALSPCDTARLDEECGKIVIPLGEQHNPFYGLSGRFFISGNDVSMKGTLHKQFTRLRFRLKRVPCHDYSVVVESDVCGVYTRTLEPVRGAFLHEFPTMEEIYECILPRQFDDSDIRIVIRNNNPDNKEKDIIIPLGESLRRERYDWAYPELADIYAYVDVVAELTVIQIIQ